MAETVMTIIWNSPQKDCQTVMYDVIVDWPRLPSEYSNLVSLYFVLYAYLYSLIYLLSSLDAFLSSLWCFCYTFSIVFVSSLLLFFEDHPNYLSLFL